MGQEEKFKITKSIIELDDKIKNYDKPSAIDLIKRVRFDHPGKEQIAYVVNNVPLEKGTDEQIINTLCAEKYRLTLKLEEDKENNKVKSM